MKKKILSIALVLGMLLSVLSGIPVSAADEAYERTLPYAFFDYEDGVNNIQGATLVDGGMAGSGKCVQYVCSAGDVNHDDKGIYLGNGEGLVTGAVPANHTFKVSFYLKVTQQLTKGNLVLFVNYRNESGTSGSNTPATTFDPTKVNEWQKVEITGLTPSENVEITGIRLRFGGHGAHLQNGNFVVGESTSAPRNYYFDDMELTVTSPFQTIPGGAGGGTVPSLPVNMNLDDYSMDFENGSSIIMANSNQLVTTAGVSNDKGSMQIIQDPNDAENTVLKVTQASATEGDDAAMNFGLSKAVSSTTRATGVIPAGGTITYTFDYYLPQAVKSNLNNLKFHPAMIISHYPGSCFATVTEPMATAENQWHTATFKYTNTGTNDLEVGAYQFRLCGTYNTYVSGATPVTTTWTVADHTGSGYGDRTFYFDNFRVTIEGPEGSTPIETADLNLNDYSMDFETESSIQVSGQNITETEAGTADELAAITADPENAGNKVMKLTTSPDYAASASTIMFSGAAGAGENKVTAPGTIPAGGKITYKFKYYLAQAVDSTKVPQFSVKHATGNVVAKSKTVFETEANVWHEAVLTYTNSKNTALAIDGATLRLAGDDANETQWKATEGDTVIYFDDFTVKTAEPAFPTSSMLRVNGTFAAGEEVDFCHTYTPTEEGAIDNSIVRFLCTYNGETASLGSCMIGDTFVVPQVPADATLSFEVVPVDSEILGVKIPYTYASVTGQEAKLTLSEFATDGSVTATAMIDNQKFDGESINAVLIVVLLNDKGGVIKYDEKPLLCLNGETISGDSGKLVVTTDNADPAMSRVTKAAAFLWYCDVNQTASFTTTNLVELVADKMVEKE